MKKADLITGFLGSGKTTFLIKYARFLMARGEKIGIIVNDYGAVNVDRVLLREALGDECELEMVLGGDDAATHMRRLRAKLIAFGMGGVDRVIIEPSGVFDMDEFFDVLRDEPLERWFEVGNVIALVEAKTRRLSEAAEFMLCSQAVCAGAVLLTKTEDAGEADIAAARDALNAAAARYGSARRFGDDVIGKPWEAMSDSERAALAACGYRLPDYVKPAGAAEKFATLLYMNTELKDEGLREKIERLLHDPKCGEVLRVKGFARLEDGRWREYNATPEGITEAFTDLGQDILIVIGENLEKAAVDALLEK